MDEGVVLDVSERWGLLAPEEAARLRARLAAVMRRIDALEHAAGGPDPE